MLPPIFPVLFLAWFFLVLMSVCGFFVHAVRHRARGFGRALLCPLGTALSGAFLSAGIGLTERTWTLASSSFWLAMCIGIVGVLLAFLGWREVLRAPRRPGECIACGYPVQGLKVCPECGRSP